MTNTNPEAARKMLDALNAMGLSISDLVTAGRTVSRPQKTVAEYLPQVRDAATDGKKQTYATETDAAGVSRTNARARFRQGCSGFAPHPASGPGVGSLLSCCWVHQYCSWVVEAVLSARSAHGQVGAFDENVCAQIGQLRTVVNAGAQIGRR
jgi:hypothetical protein